MLPVHHAGLVDDGDSVLVSAKAGEVGAHPETFPVRVDELGRDEVGTHDNLAGNVEVENFAEHLLAVDVGSFAITVLQALLELFGREGVVECGGADYGIGVVLAERGEPVLGSHGLRGGNHARHGLELRATHTVGCILVCFLGDVCGLVDGQQGHLGKAQHGLRIFSGIAKKDAPVGQGEFLFALVVGVAEALQCADGLQFADEHAFEGLVGLRYADATDAVVLDHLHDNPPCEGPGLTGGHAGTGDPERIVEVVNGALDADKLFLPVGELDGARRFRSRRRLSCSAHSWPPRRWRRLP